MVIGEKTEGTPSSGATVSGNEGEDPKARHDSMEPRPERGCGCEGGGRRRFRKR